MTGRLFFSGLIFLLLLSGQATAGEIWVISDPGDTYHAAFTTALQQSEALRGERLSVHTVDEPLPSGAQRPSLVVTLGERAGARVADKSGALLHLFITEPQFRAIYRERVPQGHSALFLEQPPERYVALVRAALPNVARVIVPIGNNHQPHGDSLRVAATRAGIVLREEVTGTPQDLDALLSRADPAKDAILFLPDPALLSNAMLKVALVGAYKYKIPLAAYSEGLVKAGALMSVHSTVPLLADETSAWIVTFLKTGNLQAPATPQRFEVAVNYQLATSLGLHIPTTAIIADRIQEVLSDR